MRRRDQLGGAAASVVLLLAATACGRPQPSATAADDREAADLVWLAARSIEENDRTTAVEMSLVRVDGSVAWSGRLDVAGRVDGATPFVVGPRAGRLAYGMPTEAGTAVVRADAGDEGAAEIATIEARVLAAVLSPDASVLYLVVEEATLEIQRLSLEPGASPERLALVARAAAEDVTISPFGGLRSTPDGEVLLLERCDSAGACSWIEVATAGGETRQIEVDGAGRLVGVSNDLLLTLAAGCDVGPCPFLIVDRATGGSTRWDPGAHNARLVSLPDGGSVLAYDTAGVGGAVRVALVDPATLDERRLGPIGEPGAELGLAREGQDAWAPAGWLVLAAAGSNLGELGGPVLVNVLDERVVRLPPPEPG